MTFPVFSAQSATGYNLDRSLRLRRSASAYLNRTPASAGNRRTFTISAWVKRGVLDTDQAFITANNDITGNNQFNISFTTANKLQVFSSTAYPTRYEYLSTAVFRDPSSWYHIVVAFDTTQASSSNRLKIYVNGVQLTAFDTAIDGGQNLDNMWNSTVIQAFGAYVAVAAQRYSDIYYTEINNIDGQALTPSSFGANNASTGVWQPKKYVGTYGTNGFYLNFTDNSALTTSSNVGLGKDFSGNGNFFATNNISITAGSTYDSMTDVPTLTSATAANFAVINPLDFSGINGTITNGNLTWTTNTTGSTNFNRATMRFPTSGKFYAECTVTQLNIGSGIGYGVVQLEGTGSYLWWVYSSPFYQIYGTGGSYSTIPTISSGDVIMVAIDMDAGKAWYGQNGTWLLSGDPANGTAMSNPATFTVGSSNIVLSFDGRTGSAANIINANFGQRPFAYTPPTGFLRLNTFNLPTPTIGATASTLAEKYMDISLYSGTSAGGNNITDGLSLSSGGLLWVKNRNASGNHALIDSVRGITKRLISDTSNAEDTVSAVTSFNANGFTLQGSDGSFNLSGRTYVGWQWLANGSGVSNTDGSITSTVSANTSAGFSVVTYTGNGTSGATVGHGLGVVPAMLIIKNRTTTPDWMVYHKNASATPQNGGMFLNRTDAFVTDSNYFNNTAPISTRFTVGGNDRVNTNGNNYVAYCFSQVAGYSAFGSYTGNGSTDGPFVFTGFRPKWIMWKNASTTSGWGMRDTSRNPSNVANLELAANADAAEVAGQGIDILSNGFKLRTADSWYNGNGNTMIYMAFAENPFKYSLAR